MKKTIIAFTALAAITLASCQKEKTQAPTKPASSQGTMKTRNGGTAMDMPATGAYKAWIENAVVTTNPLRLNNFIAGFSQQEPQFTKLNFTMVNVTIDGLGQESYGIICDLKDPMVPLVGYSVITAISIPVNSGLLEAYGCSLRSIKGISRSITCIPMIPV